MMRQAPLRHALRMAACLSLILPAPAALAFECEENAGWLAHKCARIAEALKEGNHDLYLPLHAHHGRDTYRAERIEEFNEDAFGIGFGRSVIDQRSGWRGDWHGLYIMGFRDSHHKLQTMLGYGYQTYLGSGPFKLGLGYTAFLTSRRDIASGFPIPAAVPMLSLKYGKASLMGAYVPRISGNQGNGDVLFIFGHYTY
jgi:palmitoyl transferase